MILREPELELNEDTTITKTVEEEIKECMGEIIRLEDIIENNKGTQEVEIALELAKEKFSKLKDRQTSLNISPKPVSYEEKIRAKYELGGIED